MKKYKVGYTQGVYDMFHIGHLNILNNAKEQCEFLIVGVNADDLVKDYKHKVPVINEEERKEIVANIKSVDKAIIVHTLDKVELWNEIHYDAIFIGSDWFGTPRWMQTKKDLEKYGVDVVFLPHTDNISSTMLRDVKDGAISEEKVD